MPLSSAAPRAMPTAGRVGRGYFDQRLRRGTNTRVEHSMLAHQAPLSDEDVDDGPTIPSMKEQVPEADHELDKREVVDKPYKRNEDVLLHRLIPTHNLLKSYPAIDLSTRLHTGTTGPPLHAIIMARA